MAAAIAIEAFSLLYEPDNSFIFFPSAGFVAADAAL
jgi:hypothetical protein